ncbi:unnamed protein product [Sphenostylis stenocarpa]|uniref:Uncharacterized protein n=1 Tax=Sphenostylis stenocarpa TaxID=92480 RepID=A0AA86VIZ3_9FABA|nr:unnamed protein product [Sphenostylis stenocarpa]
MDSIDLNELDDSKEWLLGERANENEEAIQEEELVFDELTWEAVAAATGSGNQPLVQEDREEEVMNRSEDKEEQIFNSESDADEDAMLDIAAEYDDVLPFCYRLY